MPVWMPKKLSNRPVKKPAANRKKRKLLFASIGFMLLVAGAAAACYRLHGASSCASVEQYDYLRGQCVITCDSDQQCEALSRQAEAELNVTFGQSNTKEAAQKPAPTALVPEGTLYTTQSTGSETNGAVYTVVDGSLQPAPSGAHQKLWQLVVALMGSDVIKTRLLSFEVFDDVNNDTGAAVWRSDDPAKWHMNINQAFTNEGKKDLIRTIVHEYGHIITLSNDQVVSVDGACPRLELSEGCGKDGSYINSYYNTFWRAYGFEATQAGALPADEAAKLYAAKPESFVSEYASSNITEDIAESFADFVTKAKPATNGASDQKVRFFYNYPELVVLRGHIRAAAANAVRTPK